MISLFLHSCQRSQPYWRRDGDEACSGGHDSRSCDGGKDKDGGDCLGDLGTSHSHSLSLRRSNSQRRLAVCFVRFASGETLEKRGCYGWGCVQLILRATYDCGWEKLLLSFAVDHSSSGGDHSIHGTREMVPVSPQPHGRVGLRAVALMHSFYPGLPLLPVLGLASFCWQERTGVADVVSLQVRDSCSIPHGVSPGMMGGWARGERWSANCRWRGGHLIVRAVSAGGTAVPACSTSHILTFHGEREGKGGGVSWEPASERTEQEGPRPTNVGWLLELLIVAVKSYEEKALLYQHFNFQERRPL